MGWAMLIASCIIMYKVAEMGDRRGWIWATITFFCCFLSSILIPLPLINIALGLFLSYVIMIGSTVLSGRRVT